ncbi:hypothetical protein AMELA_G00234060 [Ameiurus melas]|uniref:Polycystin-1 n=1 Tax=Ameiurus melas TaxID=219545 RepID=A0A7J6A0B0_AMEME|nr:hypothetical protein AMELA_G00234060 [Ameiurus melas]
MEKWVHEFICPIRMLYVGQNETKLRGPFLKAGLPQMGDYSLEVTSIDLDFPVTASCSIHIIPPLSLTLVYPTNRNGTVYFLPNRTSVLVMVQSEHSAVFGWQGSNKTAPFQSFCPQELESRVVECKTVKSNNDNLFAWLDLELGSTPGQTKVVLHAHSEVTQADLEIQARVEEPLRGLQIQPHPAHRVLMETVVSYTASVEGGTDPSFRWTVDDKPYFTYYNTVLNIIYQNAAVYKLTVTATNHVSDLTEDFNVTVDKMNPMSEITVRGVPEIVTQGDQLTLSASVAVDISVDATFLWLFRDGDKMENHFKPPYVAPHQSPDSSDKRIVLQHEVKYTYQQPGEYNLRVSVSNRYENKTHKLDVYVFSILTSVEINTEPELLQAEKPSAFEAHPLPSPYGIIYTWDFGDNSSLQQGRERRVYHAYAQSGTYTVCVNVNNTVSNKDSCKVIMVYEDVDGLEVRTSAPTEFNTPTIVEAALEAGNNVSWSFSMGDGTVLMREEPRVEHTYVKDGNYTVNVTATNAISSTWKSIYVQVFVLQVLWLEPVGCVQEKTNISFHVLVSGNASSHQYMWSFGDGTANETRYGTPTITHSYQGSGNYHLSLLMSSSVNKANFFNGICVQPKVSNVTLEPSSRFIRLGEESLLTVTAFPEFDYTYLWDFGHNGTKGNNLALRQDYTFVSYSDSDNVAYSWDFGDGTVLTGHNVTHAYNSSGIFDICVTGKNDVSENKSQIPVMVLAPIQGLSLNASLVNVPLNATVHFETHLDQGDDVRYSWILCDRCTSIPGTHPMFYTFRSVGMFNVIVTAENDISTAQASIYIFVQRELEGLQIVSDELGDSCCFATNRILHLQALLKDGTNMSFSWNLLREHEHTVALNLTGKNIDLDYSTPGPCEVLLKATNLLGQLAVNRTIEFLDPVGKLVLEASPNPTAVNAITNMTVFADSGSDLQYRWWIEGDLLQFYVPFIWQAFDSPGLKSVSVEVSNRVSKEMASVQISVQEPISGVSFTTTNATEQNFIASGVNVSLSGHVQTGSNISWMWLLPNDVKSSQRATYYIFSSPGTFTVTLNVSNDISSEVLARDFTVQDRIQGLDFKASKKNVAVGENVEFTISVASGTSVSYTLSISGDATVYPNLTYCNEPEVQVVQAPKLSIWRSKPALVEAKVDLKSCVRYGAEYLWEIFSASNCQEFENHLTPPFKVHLPAEVDVRRLQLSIPKMTLPARNYTLIFSLSYKGIPLRTSACLQLSVMSAKLVPIIEGGTYREWSKTQDLQLNANQSYDPNLDLESQTLLNYHWECVNTSEGARHCSTLNFRLGPKDLVISGSELEVEVEYTFRLTVSKDGMSPESTTQKVFVKSGRIPIVSLECVSCKAQSRYEISQNSYVYLAGTCSNCQGAFRGRWTAVNRRSEPLVLDLNTTTTGQDGMNLVLRKGALRDRESYVFSWHVTDDSMEQEGVANIELHPNLPPAGGSCSLWSDGEGPEVYTLLERVHFKCKVRVMEQECVAQ